MGEFVEGGEVKVHVNGDGGREGGEGELPSLEFPLVDEEDENENGVAAGARTTHFPSVSHPPTRFIFVPHCSRNFAILASSIHPVGVSKARVVRVVRTAIGGFGDEGVSKEVEKEEDDE